MDELHLLHTVLCHGRLRFRPEASKVSYRLGASTIGGWVQSLGLVNAATLQLVAMQCIKNNRGTTPRYFKLFAWDRLFPDKWICDDHAIILDLQHHDVAV